MKIDWTSIPSPATAALPPWKQLAEMVRKADADRASYDSYPRLILRGNRAYLRSLRASEMVAWDAAGKSFSSNQS